MERKKLTVVWEWENRQGRWLPYSAAVTKGLERAHEKNLNQVILGDVDASLSEFSVNLNQMVQCSKLTGQKFRVRRQLYPNSSPPGKGVRWEWAADSPGDWRMYDMPVQCVIEQEWSKGGQTVDISQTFLQFPYIINFCNMTQVRNNTGFVRNVRRSQHDVYPHVKTDAPNKVPLTGADASAILKPSSSPGSSSNVCNGSTAGPSRSSTRRLKSDSDTSIHKSKRKRAALSKLPASKGLLSKWCHVIESPEDEDCTICFEKLSEASSYSDDGDALAIAFMHCSHSFHYACLKAMMSSAESKKFVQCPTCKMIYGEKHGNQPRDGRMTWRVIGTSLAGHEDCNTIEITYHFKSGIQGPEHPNPKKRFHCVGFPRVCYLPNNEKGQKVLRLLDIAFKRRLIFTVGVSSTTSQPDCVTWNEIHHKTTMISNVAHGYPDPNYLDNVMLELASQGVMDDDDD